LSSATILIFDRYIETYPDHGDADALRAAQGRFRDAMANMPECTALGASRYLWKTFFREVRYSMSPKTAAAEKARGVPWNNEEGGGVQGRAAAASRRAAQK